MSCKCFNRRFVFKNTDSFDHKYVNSKCKCTSRFTICENKSKFTIASKDISEVDKIKIDGYFDSSSEHRKCDYLFVYTSPLSCVYIFVELKGTDIAHAITQIGNTVNLFYNQGYLKDKKVTQLYTLMYQTKYLILYYQLQGKIKPTYLRNRSVLK